MQEALRKVKREVAHVKQQQRRGQCLICKLVFDNRQEHTKRCLKSFMQDSAEELLAELPPLPEPRRYDELTDEGWSSGEDDYYSDDDGTVDDGTVEYAQSVSDEADPMEQMQQTMSWMSPVQVPEVEVHWSPAEPSQTLVHTAGDNLAAYATSGPRSPSPVRSVISDGSYIGDFRAAVTTSASQSGWHPPAAALLPPAVPLDGIDSSALDGLLGQTGWNAAISTGRVHAVSADPGGREARLAAARSRVAARVESAAHAESVGSLEARIRARRGASGGW